jgi:2'-5' RNA ligase
MALIGFAVPSPTARLLSEIDVPGAKEPVENFHITLLMLDDETSIADIADAMEAAYSVASTIRPFTARVTRIASFPKGNDGVPVICPVEAPELHAVWVAMKQAFDAKHVGYSKKFPEFKPHVTLSYADKPYEAELPIPIEWGAHELVVWGGDRGDRRVVVHLPFTLVDRVACRYRIAALRQRNEFQGRSRVRVTNRLVDRFKAGY